MKKEITISYQNRTGRHSDLPAVPKIVLANHLLNKLSGFSIGEKIIVEYNPNEIIIKKLNYESNK